MDYIQSSRSHCELDQIIRSASRLVRVASRGEEKRLLCRIVRELEKIPEPMQLSLLDFIRSLGNSYTATNQPETKSVGSQKRDPF